ncbi:MAG: phosphatase PAP2 family protein [Pseudomonadales bacterium]
MQNTPKLLQNLHQYDLRVMLWCAQSRNHNLLVQVAKQVSRTGDGWLQLIFPLGLILFSVDDSLLFFKMLIVGFLIERPLYWVLKNSLKRRRPPEAIPCFQSVITASDKFSFPSGHTAAAFLLATLVLLVYGTAAWVLLPWAVCVGASRIVLGVHFPGDIIAGAILGTSIGYYAAYLVA